jgi:hypothetical protein
MRQTFFLTSAGRKIVIIACISSLDAGLASAHTCLMTPPSDGPAAGPGGEKPLTGRLLQGLLIVAIMALIAIAVVSFH